MNKRKALDVKTVSSPNAVHLVKFVHEYTKKGYEPVLNQVASVFGNTTVCMALYEPERVDEENAEASADLEVKTDEVKTDEVKTDEVKTDEVKTEQETTKPATKSRAKPKAKE